MDKNFFIVPYRYWDREKEAHVFGKVRVTVDPHSIGKLLGPKARNNKSKVAKEISGHVVVEIIS